MKLEKYSYPDREETITSETITRFGNKRWVLEEKYVLDNFRKLIGESDISIDAGSGVGRLIPYLKKFSRKVLAMDPDPQRLEYAIKSYNNMDNVFFLYGHIGDMSFIPTETISTVLCSHVFQHTTRDEIMKGIKEFNRILYDDGYLILMLTHSPDKEKFLLRRKGTVEEVTEEEFNKFVTNPVEGILPVWKLSVDGIIKTLEENGFKLVKMYYYHIKPEVFPQKLLMKFNNIPDELLKSEDFPEDRHPLIMKIKKMMEKINRNDEIGRKSSIDSAYLFKKI